LFMQHGQAEWTCSMGMGMDMGMDMDMERGHIGPQILLDRRIRP
jgi:hypothetical protein